MTEVRLYRRVRVLVRLLASFIWIVVRRGRFIRDLAEVGITDVRAFRVRTWHHGGKYFIGRSERGQVCFVKLHGADAFRRIEVEALTRLAASRDVAPRIVAVGTRLPYVAVEYIDGVDLRTWICEMPRTSEELRAIARDFVRIYSALRSARIVHRDIRPENLIVFQGSIGPSLRVIDFGTAILRDEPHLNAMLQTAIRPDMGRRLGGAYRRSNGQWDDAYSFGLIARELEACVSGGGTRAEIGLDDVIGFFQAASDDIGKGLPEVSANLELAG